MHRFRLITYNIRKGKGASGKENGCVRAIGEALRALSPDVVLCQEVFQPLSARGRTPGAGQSQILADCLGLSPYYGVNRTRRHGRVGNAILSGPEVERVFNHDVTTNLLEKRGVLYARLEMGGRPLHVFNAHLGLNQPQRMRQIRRIDAIVRATCAPDEAVLLAGDFNDWTRRLDHEVVSQMGFVNALSGVHGKDALTWHVRRPVFNLDRVYVRHLKMRRATRLGGSPWQTLSDHFPLMAELEFTDGPRGTKLSALR